MIPFINEPLLNIKIDKRGDMNMHYNVEEFPPRQTMAAMNHTPFLSAWVMTHRVKLTSNNMNSSLYKPLASSIDPLVESQFHALITFNQQNSAPVNENNHNFSKETWKSLGVILQQCYSLWNTRLSFAIIDEQHAKKSRQIYFLRRVPPDMDFYQNDNDDQDYNFDDQYYDIFKLDLPFYWTELPFHLISLNVLNTSTRIDKAVNLTRIKSNLSNQSQLTFTQYQDWSILLESIQWCNFHRLMNQTHTLPTPSAFIALWPLDLTLAATESNNSFTYDHNQLLSASQSYFSESPHMEQSMRVETISQSSFQPVLYTTTSTTLDQFPTLPPARYIYGATHSLHAFRISLSNIVIPSTSTRSNIVAMRLINSMVHQIRKLASSLQLSNYACWIDVSSLMLSNNFQHFGCVVLKKPMPAKIQSMPTFSKLHIPKTTLDHNHTTWDKLTLSIYNDAQLSTNNDDDEVILVVGNPNFETLYSFKVENQ